MKTPNKKLNTFYDKLSKKDKAIARRAVRDNATIKVKTVLVFEDEEHELN